MRSLIVIAMGFIQLWCVDGCRTTVSYSCYKSNSKEKVTLEWCWDITHLFSCTKSSFKTVLELDTCFRDECCPGHGESSCSPLCFGDTTCPNGGSCIRPDFCACANGFAGDRCEDIDECVQLNGRCSHDCTNTMGSYYCSCPEGFIMETNMHTCIEIRTPQPSSPPGECAFNNGNCSHECVETKNGVRQCYCPKGHELSENGTTCVVIELLPPVLVSINDNFQLDVILMLSLSLITLLALLVICCFRRKSFDWHVRASASMTSFVHNVKQTWGEWRQSGKPRYEKIKTVNEEYENDDCQYSDLKQPLIVNEDIICNI